MFNQNKLIEKRKKERKKRKMAKMMKIVKGIIKMDKKKDNQILKIRIKMIQNQGTKMINKIKVLNKTKNNKKIN